ncbi:polymeric immunoglobulin receptor-like isoform X2 [Scomber scombrus]
MKGDYAHRKTVIKSTDTVCKQTQDRKYDLCNDTKKRILHVTIYNLNLRDAGTYWCEIDAYTFDPITEVNLKVHKAPTPVKPQPVNLNPPMSTTVETISMNQQQSTRTTAFMNLTVNVSGPALSSTPVEEEQTVTVNISGPAVSSTPVEDEKTVSVSLLSVAGNNRGPANIKYNKQQKVYTVTISELTQADARRYQCAMKNSISNSIECLTKIHLHVLDLDDVNTTKILHSTKDSIYIKCNYPASDENKEKFLCKGDNPFICEELINTTAQGRDMTKDRFTINDNRRCKYFFVYIKNPSIDDSGTYWCSSDRMWQHAPYAKIHLTVEKNKNLSAEKHQKKKKSGPPAMPGTAGSMQKDQSPTTSSHPANASEKGVIVGVVVSLALLLIAVFALILLCRHKLTMTQGGSSEQRTNTGNDTEGHDGDHYYEDIQANLGNTLPSIYVTVSHPADQLHYNNINFQTDSVSISTDGNTLPDAKTSCEYSSISKTQTTTNPPAAVQPLYSTVIFQGNTP